MNSILIFNHFLTLTSQKMGEKCYLLVLYTKRILFHYVLDFVLSDEQKKEMSLEEQYKDLVDKVEMTQAIKHGGICDCFIDNIYNVSKILLPYCISVTTLNCMTWNICIVRSHK